MIELSYTASPPDRVRDVIAALTRYRYFAQDERGLYQAFGRNLERAGLHYQRLKRMGWGRVQLFSEGVVVEVACLGKEDHGVKARLLRYAVAREVVAVVVVGTHPSLAKLRGDVLGKPLEVVQLELWETLMQPPARGLRAMVGSR